MCAVDLLLAPTEDGAIIRSWEDGEAVGPAEHVTTADLPDAVRRRERDTPRWVWPDTRTVYPQLLAHGVRVTRCHDLRLTHAILRHAGPDDTAPPPWLAEPVVDADPRAAPALLDVLGAAPPTPGEVEAEATRQHDVVRDHEDAGRLRLLLAAESAGALVAAELRADGLPWDLDRHDRILTDLLGPRPQRGARPSRLEALAVQVRGALDAPTLNPDSPVALLAALRAAGCDVRTTARWALRDLDHPVVAPLLEYKSLARLLSANGWAWAQAWVEPAPAGAGRRGRLRTDYVPGGVVTGRWATSGGGALQIPKAVRAAVVADPGHRLVVADAAQIEPRCLAAMSGDDALMRAGRDGDLYAGLVAAGVVATRDHAKIGMLSALYGGTAGDAGAVLPRLRAAYPRALGLVDHAARVGEAGGTVRTWLGRTSPPPGDSWTRSQARANGPDGDPAAQTRARAQARDRGRFTRNFVVQGTAAEWALAWMAQIRLGLAASTPTAHLAYFLHDEVVVHAPADAADAVAHLVQDAADRAGRLLFGDRPITFPLQVRVAETYAEAT